METLRKHKDVYKSKPVSWSHFYPTSGLCRNKAYLTHLIWEWTEARTAYRPFPTSPPPRRYLDKKSNEL